MNQIPTQNKDGLTIRSTNAEWILVCVKYTFKMFHSTIIIYKTHEPKLMCINRYDLNVLLSRI